jgi:hypothetical protein
VANASSIPLKQGSPPSATSDLTALKIRQQAAWSSGNYAVVGVTLQIVGEQLCETLSLKPGSKVLDVAAGNGMASLAAARRWGKVTSTDYVPALLQSGRARAEAEGHPIEFIEAGELLRVCKPKGQIGLANWTPEGFIGQIFKTLGRYLPPPASAKSPALWGTRARLAELFADAASDIKTESRQFNFRYRSPKHFLEVFETYYGPINRAFAALDMQRQTELRNDLHALIVRMNRGSDGTMLVPSEYLEVVITKA